MNLPQNLQYLRKRDKITQEDLADKLGVSRQSVSKWETGEAYPETDKLILICDLFGTTLDELIRGDLTASAAPAAKACTGDYARRTDVFSRAMAAGVFMILVGVALCMALNGYAETLSEKYRELTEILSGAAVVLFVGIALFLFIYYGMSYDNFRKENPIAESVYTEAEIKAFKKKFALVMAALCTAILIDVVFLILTTSFIDLKIINASNADSAYCFVTAAFLAVLSLIIGAMVYYGTQRAKYIVEEYNRHNRKKKPKLADAICGAVMMTAAGIYLIIGFVGGWWHPGWVVFPVGGIICTIVSTILNAKNGEE